MNQSNDAAQVNTKVLDQLYRAIKTNKITARVGILGSKVARKDSVSNNATIGAAHEYGSPSRGLPVRSFLRMPITEMLPKELEKASFFNEDMLKANLQNGNLKTYVDQIAIAAVGVVLQAFATGGFGKWKPLTKYTLKHRQGTQILVVPDSHQLRDSIDHEVK